MMRYIHLAHTRNPVDKALSILSVPIKNAGIRNTVYKIEQKERALIDLSTLLSSAQFFFMRFKCFFLSCFIFHCSPGNRKPTIAPDNANKITIKMILITLITTDLSLSSGTVLSTGHVKGQSTHAHRVEPWMWKTFVFIKKFKNLQHDISMQVNLPDMIRCIFSSLHEIECRIRRICNLFEMVYICSCRRFPWNQTKANTTKNQNWKLCANRNAQRRRIIDF